MKKINHFISKIVVGGFLLFMSSCEEFIDMNADPNNPTVAQLNLLLPATQLGIVGNFDAINRGASAVAQHRASGNLNRYNQTGSTFQSSWLGFYTGAIPDFETIIEEGTLQGNWGYVAVAKLQKAYLYSLMVDLWGDVPYFEAAKIPDPKFDNGATIYNDLLNLINEALLDMEKGFSVSSSADLFYQGSKEKWQKMAYSLKLKMYLQTRKVDPEQSRARILDILEQDVLMGDNADDFTFKYGTNTSPNSRHPWYVAGYSPSRDGYMSMVVVDRLMEQDDPRLRYYIFRMNEKAGLANSQVGEGYYGRYPGDGTSSPADQSTVAIVGVYPSAGLYDNGMVPSLSEDNLYLTNIGAVGGTSSNSFKVALFANGDGTGAGIQPFIANAMVKFYRAEAALTLGTGENAGELLRQAVIAHFQSINSLAPTFPISEETMTGFTQRLLTEFENANDQRKMEILMMQKWIAMYGNGVESYNDYRRTGLPVLEDLMAPLDVFPERLYFSETELTSNETVVNIREQLQRDQQIVPVFWRK